MITGQTRTVAPSSASAKVAGSDGGGLLVKGEIVTEQESQLALVLAHSRELATVVDRSVGARKAVPVRASFVRNDNNPQGDAPLKKLVSRGGGRGGAVPVLLYIALIWKCAKKPFDVKLSARQWADLLGLPDSSGKGARRVANALNMLEGLKLIKLEKVHGEPSRVTLLDESGEGSDYELPSTAYSQRGLKRDLYFKISSKLWTSGEIQQLGAPGLVMLLILLQEGGYKPDNTVFAKVSRTRPQGKEVWFTTENFPARYGISASMRSRGTKELEEARLLLTYRRPVGPPGTRVSFTVEKVRKVYMLQGNAVVEDNESPRGKPPKTAARKTARKTVRS